MKKYILSFIMTLLLCLGVGIFGNATEVYAASSGTSGTCSWTLDDEGVLTIYPTDGVSGILPNIRITKDATNGTSQNADDTFTIEIEFRNESGMPINDDIYWYVEGGAATPSEITDNNQE